MISLLKNEKRFINELVSLINYLPVLHHKRLCSVLKRVLWQHSAEYGHVMQPVCAPFRVFKKCHCKEYSGWVDIEGCLESPNNMTEIC